jgi:NAD(P)-dependent dehydrogenase (short-subunit alcohol dehydrogenase family)
MKALCKQGTVVNVSSIAAIIPIPSMTPYSVAKAAQDTLTRNLALEFAPKGVRINAVQPGNTQIMFNVLGAPREGLLHIIMA